MLLKLDILNEIFCSLKRPKMQGFLKIIEFLYILIKPLIKITIYEW